MKKYWKNQFVLGLPNEKSRQMKGGTVVKYGRYCKYSQMLKPKDKIKIYTFTNAASK